MTPDDCLFADYMPKVIFAVLQVAKDVVCRVLSLTFAPRQANALITALNTHNTIDSKQDLAQSK